MKVLYILQDFNPFADCTNVVGGHIAHIIGVVEAFQRLGHDVVVSSFDRVPYWNNKSVTYRLFRTKESTSFKGRGVLRQRQMTSQMVSAIRIEKPDLIYVRWSQNLFFYRVRKTFPDLPIVMECNTAAEMNYGDYRPGYLERWLLHKIDQGFVRSASLVSAVSRETRDFLLRHHPDVDPCRVIINPNGVDTNRFRYMENNVKESLDILPSDIVIGYTGNFCTWHRIDLLIRAFQELNMDNVRLMIIGTGPSDLCENLRALADKKRPSQITFTGPVPFDQIPEYLSACDILVAPQSYSMGDTFHQSPIKLFEYMATGRAVVGSRIGQIGMVIEDGRNGLLFEPDAGEDLQRVLKRLIIHPSLRNSLGETARSDVKEKYTWEANVLRILQGLEEIN
ncbi:glycosyltransferase family 4 protein [Thermodesulfobacteriota bacterium]